jgi:hypothetical protein
MIYDEGAPQLTAGSAFLFSAFSHCIKKMGEMPVETPFFICPCVVFHSIRSFSVSIRENHFDN